MRKNPYAIERALKILPNVTTLDVVRAFLDGLGLPHSAGSWDAMVNDRLAVYLADGRLGMAEFMDLLRESEEYGNQHVFLFACSATDAARLMDPERIRRELRRIDREELLDRPDVLEEATSLSLVDVRFDKLGRDSVLVVKAVETRLYTIARPLIDHGDYLTRRWDKERVRAVSVAELHRDGTLQLRIHQHRNTTKYEKEINAFWKLIEPIIPQSLFKEVPLLKLRNKIAQGKAKIGGRVRRGLVVARNSEGVRQTMAAASYESPDLFTSRGATAAVSGFMKHDSAACEGAGVRWEPEDGAATPSRTLHVTITGRSNEFAITVNCTRSDHHFVLDRLRRAGK